MPQLILKIDQLTDRVFSNNVLYPRRCMLELSRNLINLRWQYRPAEGGMWQGEVEFRLPQNTKAWRQLKRGRHGAAWLYWEPEQNRTMTAFDAEEHNRLLWFGTLEDVRLDPEGEICRAKMKGAGQFLKDFTIDMVDETNGLGGTDTIKNHAENCALHAQIFDGFFNLIDSDQVAAAGAFSRKAYLDESNTPASEILAKLASSIGGVGMVSWGVRPAGGADDLGELYFLPWSSGLWERTASWTVPTWQIGPKQIESIEVGRRTSAIKNHILVLGKDGQKVYHGEARSSSSIAKHGVHKHRVVDSSVKSVGHAALIASGILEESGTPPADVTIVVAEPLDRGDQANHADGAEAGFLQTVVKGGGRSVVAMLNGLTSPASLGEANYIASMVGGSGAAALVAIDTSSSGLSNGRWHPNPKANNNLDLENDDGLLYVQQGKFTGSNPSNTMNLWELDRKLCGVLGYVSGNNYVFALLQHQTSGWTIIHTDSNLIPFQSGGTNKNLTDLHTFAFEVSASGTIGIDLVKGWFVDATGTRTLICNKTVTPGSYSSSGTKGIILVNGALGTGGGGVGTNAWSRSYDLSAFDVYSGDGTSGTRDYAGATAEDFIDELAGNGTLFKRAAARVLSLHLGMLSLGTGAGGTDQCQVRYAYRSEFERKVGFDATLTGGGGTTFTDDVSSNNPSNPWLLGGGGTKRYLGAGLEIAPREVTVSYQGRNNPLRVEIRGAAPAATLTGVVETMKGTIDTVQRLTDG
ncbi:MAG: hypothetical protein HQ519_00065 [Planctomycetes bacterium]|nr:hypothetical protein [Planctomycetota bacterium]